MAEQGLCVTPSRALSQAPSPNRQKTFIIENAGNLDRVTKMSIMSIVMMEIDKGAVSDATRGVEIDLDKVAIASSDVLFQIYNIVRARIESLSQPARPDAPGVDRR